MTFGFARKACQNKLRYICCLSQMIKDLFNDFNDICFVSSFDNSSEKSCKYTIYKVFMSQVDSNLTALFDRYLKYCQTSSYLVVFSGLWAK